MALKTEFTEEEQYGLTQEELKIGLRYLRKHKTAGKIPDVEALKVFEMYLIGHSFQELTHHFPQYPLGQIILTACLAKWGIDREKMQHTLKDRVQAKVIKSILEQVDFLTTLLSVNNVENLDAMRKYIYDPGNNPRPNMHIETIKEYKDVVETLQKIVTGSSDKGKTVPPLFANLNREKPAEIDRPKDVTPAQLISQAVEEEE